MKKYVIKDYLHITIAFDFCWSLIVRKGSVKWVVFLFFPNFIYLPMHILDKKGIDATFKQKGKTYKTNSGGKR